MKIGVTLEDDKGLAGKVSSHFGQCSHFLIAEVEDGIIKEANVVVNDAEHGGGGCVAVDEILKHGIEYVIAGGMGMGAQQKFALAGVKIFGASGNVKAAIEGCIANQLGGLGACKDGHEHQGGCHI